MTTEALPLEQVDGSAAIAATIGPPQDAEPSTDPEPVDESGAESSEYVPPEDARDAVLEPLYLSRHQSPTKALYSWMADRLLERRTRITGTIVDDEGTHWDGVQVVPWPDVLAILGGDLPVPHPMSAEIADGGDLYVALRCPKCGVTVRIKTEVDSEYKLRGGDGGVSQLKVVFKAKTRTHVCGQAELPLAEAEGQTEAFTEAPAQVADEAAVVVPLEDVMKLLDAIDDQGLLDDDTVGWNEDEAAAWTSSDRGLVYEWAWAVVHGEPERPPVPAVLRVREPEAPVETPLGEQIDGGTGDPDGDLLP